MLGGDNRLGYLVDEPVRIAEQEDGTVAAEPLSVSDMPYPCMVALRVPQTDGKSVVLTDYASVGKTWDETSRCAVWLPIPEEC